MGKPVIWAVCKRDLRGWFGNPTGYVFIMLFVLLAAAAMVLPASFFNNNLANLDSLNGWFPLLAVMFAAVITMGMWTSERTQGTQELLFTLPARDADILLGKFLAAAGVFTVSLAFTLTLPLGLSMLGSPDWGQILSNYLGFWLLGVSLISVAMLGSQLSDNLAVSFVLGALAAGLVVYGGWLLQAAWPEAGKGWNVNGPLGQFADFARGLATPAGVLLFVGMIVSFLYLNLALLSRRHSSGRVSGPADSLGGLLVAGAAFVGAGALRMLRRRGDYDLTLVLEMAGLLVVAFLVFVLWRMSSATGRHRGVRFLALAVGTGGLTLFAVWSLPRVDLTVEGIHSLSGETRKLLKQLNPDRPVFVTAYVSEDVPQDYVQTRRNLINLLDQFDSLGGGAVQVRVVPTEPFSDVAQEAESNFGIVPNVVRTADGGTYSESGVYLGLAFQCGTEDVVIPFVDRAAPIEYEMMRSIRTAAAAERRKLGVLKTDVELAGGFDFQTFQQKPRWQIVDELKLQYEVDTVDPDSDYPADLDAMIVPQVSSLSQEQMDRLRTWLQAGNPALIIEDPEPLDAPGTAATDPKGGRQNPMMGMQQPPGQKGDLAGFLGSFGVSMSVHDVVRDASYQAFPNWRLPPEFVFVGPAGANRSDPVSDGVQRAVFLVAGHLRAQDRQGLSFTPLLRSVAKPSGTIPKLDVFQFNPFGGPKQWNERRRGRVSNEDYVLAARVTGAPPAASNGDGGEGAGAGKPQPLSLVFLSDLDFISNQFFAMRRSLPDANLQFDNVTFVLNCIDHLVGDTSLIELRSRRPQLRTLERVAEAQKRYEDEWSRQREAAEELAKQELDEAQARLDAAVAKVQDDPTLDQFAKEMQVESIRQNEQRRLDVRKAEIEREKLDKIREATHRRDTQKREVQAVYKGWTLVLTPLPALLMGLVMFFRRRARETQIVPSNRMVRGGAA